MNNLPNGLNGSDDDDDLFFESLDRLLSSASSSTSASDDDSDDPRRRHHHHHHHRHRPLPTSLELWLSEPASVHHRRLHLLRLLGLSSDPALSRGLADPSAIARSVSCDALSSYPDPTPNPIPRSRSDGAVDPTSGSPVPGNLGFCQQVQQQHRHQQQRSIHFPVVSKPPLVSRYRPMSSGCVEVGGGGEEEEEVCSGGNCLIKNLDNGKEFVVKEIREDGTWGKLREVGTGRQLTMEEFEMCVGRSPIVQELMRRQNVEESSNNGESGSPGEVTKVGGGGGCNRNVGVRSKRRVSWLRTIRNVAGTMVAGGNYYCDRRSSDERDTSSEKGGRRSSSATDDSQDASHSLYNCPARVKVRQYGKSQKELSSLYMTQEIHAHNGSIWSIKFSLDGRYLASAGEDCVIHVWEVLKTDKRGDFLNEKDENGSRNPFSVAANSFSPELAPVSTVPEGNYTEKKRKAKLSGNQKSTISEPLVVPEHIFSLSEKPVCSFRGHMFDVFDLCWSESQYLLSSSMDKTVRLWHMSSPSCLKTFSHSDYVTCIHFNPVDDRYFISGSLDRKVRMWSIPNRQIVGWTDLHEMVTAACYTPDGQGALVGSHSGNCHVYDTSDNKLMHKSETDLENKKKKSRCKKITGFQFSPRNTSKVLVTAADSRIHVVDGDELVHKFKGFRNTNSQISAYFTPNGKHVICASEDSHVYLWKHDDDCQPSKNRSTVTTTQSYEYFHCQGVTVAVPWPKTSMDEIQTNNSSKQNGFDSRSQANSPPAHETNERKLYPSPAHRSNISQQPSPLLTTSNRISERVSATWPEELVTGTSNSQTNGVHCSGGTTARSRSAWGLVIVTAGQGGEIRTFQNFGFPIRV